MTRDRRAKIKVGIAGSRVMAHSPRGVVRVARAIAERLVGQESLAVVALSDPIYERNDILFESHDMGRWLQDHPMRLPDPPPPPQPPPPPAAPPPVALPPETTTRARLKRVLTKLRLRRPARFLRRLVHQARPVVKRRLKTILVAIGLGAPARRVWRRLRGLPAVEVPASPPAPVSTAPGPPPPAAPAVVPSPPPSYLSLHDLDVIISFEAYEPIWDWPTELFRCKVIGFFHDAIPFRINEGPYWNPAGYFRALARMVYRAAMISCDSRSSEQDLHAFFPNSRDKTQVIHLGHDQERYLPAPNLWHSPQGQAAALQAIPGKKVAMIGELEARKNQAGVFRACQHLAAGWPGERLTLVLIGKVHEPHPYAFLEQQARKYVDVVYLGYVPDEEIGPVLRACDAFLFPSLWEGFGIPVLEAMSAGVPVVCAESSSLPEVGGSFAFYCDPHDPRSIAAAALRALSLSADERRSLIQQARAWASAFTWDRTVQELCAAIRKCLEGTRGEEPATDEDSGTPQAGPTASPKLFREDSIPKLSRVG